MAKKTKTEVETTWGDVERHVLTGLDMGEAGVRYAVKRWRDDVAEARQADDPDRVAHTFVSREVIKATIDYFRADIADNEAIYRLKVARSKRRKALMDLHTALGEHDGFFVDEQGGERIVPERLAVTRVDKAAQINALHRVVQASIQLAKSNGDGAVEEPAFPADLGDGIRDFENDLKEFIRANGDQGREMVLRVCEDRDFATEVIANEEMPKSVRFLAAIVVETVMKNRIPERPPVFGFAAHRPVGERAAQSAGFGKAGVTNSQ